ncbi:hypothetical protein SALBM135S_00445 [Streptomyces alboniger]
MIPLAMSTASGTPQRKSPASGLAPGGTSGSARPPMARPVHSPKPVNTTAPAALATRQGSSRAARRVPARPAASTTRTAATSGPPRMVEIAAVEPAVARIAVSCPLRSRAARVRPAASSAIPLPRAIRGASGPRTTPSGRVASAATMTPGSSRGPTGAPPSPCTGGCPPPPGARATTGARTAPASASAGRGHHQGARAYPTALGRDSQISCWSQCWSPTKKKQASAVGTPRSSESSSTRGEARLSRVSCGACGAS